MATVKSPRSMTPDMVSYVRKPARRPEAPPKGTYAYTTTMLTYGNRTLSIAEWCAAIPGLKLSTVASRRRKKWTDGQCLGYDEPPPKPVEITRATYNGETLTFREW